MATYRFPRDPQEYREHLLKALRSIEINLNACMEGDEAGALTVADQLYKILVDRQGGTTLVERVIPNLALHPTKNSVSNPNMYLFSMPVSTHFHESGVSLEVFDINKSRIPLAQWLQQNLAVAYLQNGDKGVPISIKDFLYMIRNHEGSHTMTTLHEKMKGISDGLGIFCIGGKEYNLYYLLLLMIGGYAIAEIQSDLKRSSP
jgi:hypothetical protein